MPNCASIDPLVTAYVDGEIGTADRSRVDEHLSRCAPCRSRVAAERTVRELCRDRKPWLREDCAPAALRERCARLAHAGSSTNVPQAALSLWRGRVAPLAAAASFVLVAGGVLYQLTSSSNRVMAAELTADHVKCFAMNAVLHTAETPQAVRESMASSFDWNVELPALTPAEGFELVGSRPCLYAEGRVAHIMYRHNGQPVSLFMLPKTSRSAELVDVLGHEAAIWSAGDHTFVLIARESQADVQRLVDLVRASIR